MTLLNFYTLNNYLLLLLLGINNYILRCLLQYCVPIYTYIYGYTNILICQKTYFVMCAKKKNHFLYLY